MKLLSRLSFAAALACTLLFAVPASQAFGKPGNPSAQEAVSITATIFGHFVPITVGRPGWIGYMLVQIGDNPVKVATFTDYGEAPPTMREDGSLVGAETITVTFDDGSSFLIAGVFEAHPCATPGLFILHETGTIQPGTGVFANASGCVVIKGPFLFPEKVLNPAAEIASPPWIAQLQGRIRGL